MPTRFMFLLVIKISECAMLYIGSSRRALRVFICEHRSRIRNPNMDVPLVMHFMEKNHTADDFKFTVLEHLQADKFNRTNDKKLVASKIFNGKVWII